MAAAVRAGTPSSLAIFRNRNFNLLWGGRLASTAGGSLASLAASILAYRITHSAMSVGLMLMAAAAPSLLLGLTAGVIVDRLDRRRIMIASDLVRAALVFAIPFLVPQNVFWLYFLVLLASGVSTVFDPAYASVVPAVVRDEELASANAPLAISSFGSAAVGFAVSGLIAAQFPVAWAFYAGAATLLFSGLCVWLAVIPPIEAKREKSLATVYRNLQDGAAFLVNTPALLAVFGLAPFLGVSFGLWNSLLLPFARQALGASEFQYGLQEGLALLGFVVSSLLMARVSCRLREGQWLVISSIGMGVAALLYASVSSIGLAMAMVVVSGFLIAPSSVARDLIIQRSTPRETRGSVSSVFFVTRDVAFLIGMAAAGLADLWGVRALMAGSALLALVPGAVALVMPGLGEPAVEWRRLAQLLGAASLASRPSAERPATLSDLDLLAGRIPAFASLTPLERRALVAQSSVIDVPSGATVAGRGEGTDAVYFILAGRAVAGAVDNGGYAALEIMHACEFFGEMGARAGTPRPTNAVADDAATLLRVPAGTFGQLMENAKMGEIVRLKRNERLSRTSLGDLPRFATVDQAALKELRTSVT